MAGPEGLFLLRLLHTVIYLVMAGSQLLVLQASLTDAHGPWLPPALVFILTGWQPPA